MTVKVKNLGASIRQRLKNRSRDMGMPFDQLLQRYAIERFLFRLGVSEYRDMFVLKGAQMFIVWRADCLRPTMDIDLLGFTSNSLENLENIAKQVCSMNTDEIDTVHFEPESVKAVRIKEDAEYEGVRLTFKVGLGVGY